MRTWTTRNLAISVGFAAALGLATAGCGGGDEVTCGEGTSLSGGACVSDSTGCEAGTILFEGACVSASEICGTGTVFVTGTCVRDDEFVSCPAGEALIENVCTSVECGAGSAFSNGECIPFDGVTCGPGTSLFEGECVADDNPCEPGEFFDGERCVPQTSCGQGTVRQGNDCVLIDPLTQADVLEGAEPNDGVYGDATEITLPPMGTSIGIGGTIQPSTDWDTNEETVEPDFDAYEFMAQAGQRIQWEVTAVGVPSVAAYLEYVNEDAGQVITYERVGIPFASRNAVREIVMPLNGRYRLVIGDKSNFLRWSGTSSDDLGVWDGADDYTYFMEIRTIANPAPSVQSAIPFDTLGVASTVPQIRIDLPADTLVNLELVPEDPTAELRYWASSADYSEYFGVFAGGTHAVPEGGLLITADYEFSTTSNTRYELHANPVTATFVGTVDSTASINYTGVEIGAGDARYYRIDVSTPIVLHTTVAASASSSANPLVQVRDEFLRVIGQSNTGGVVRSLSIALDPGRYYIVPVDQNPGDAEGTFTVDISVTASELIQLEGGQLSQANPQLTVSDNSLGTLGADTFFFYDLAGVADATLEARPGAQLDVFLDAFLSPVLATGGTYQPNWSSNAGGQGSIEAISRTLGDLRVWARVRTVDLLAASTVIVEARIDTDTQVPSEIEPNNEPGSATDLGLITTERTVRTHGDLSSVSGSVTDWYEFSVDVPSLVRFDVTQLGSRSAEAVVTITNASGDELVVSPASTTARGETGVEPGSYFVSISTPNGLADTSYLLTGSVQFVYEACVPTTDQCVANSVNRCNAGGTSLTVIDCTLACTALQESGSYCQGENEDEVNDDSGSANDIGILADGRTVRDGFLEDRGAIGDVDWYRFRIEGQASVSISTESDLETGIAVDTEIWVYTASDPTIPILSDNDSNGSGLSRIANQILEPGIYFVRVQYNSLLAPPVPGGYRLVFDSYSTVCPPAEDVCSGNTLAHCNALGTDFESTIAECFVGCAYYDSVAACDHAIEVESESGGARNDAATSGQLLTTGVGRTSLEGTIDNGFLGTPDADWYTFSLTERTNVTVRVGQSLLSSTPVDTAVNLYNRSDTATAIASNDGNPTDVLSNVDLVAGDYAIRIAEHFNTINATGSYRMTLDIDEPACVSGTRMCTGANEIEYCTNGQPTLITCDVPCASDACYVTGSTPISGTISSSMQLDSYTIMGAAGSTRTFTIDPSASADSRIYLCAYGAPDCTYDAGYLSRANQGGADGTDQITQLFDSDDVYTVNVEFWFGALGTYDLTMSP